MINGILLRNEEGKIIGIPNFKTKKIDPIPMESLEFNGEYIYTGKDKLMTRGELKKIIKTKINMP